MDNPKIFNDSTREGPILNLKTNPEETILAMKRVEPIGWESEQRDSDTNYIDGALKWINNLGPNDTGGYTYIVYGFGGDNRWYVEKDGNIRFSKKHGTPESILRAKSEGFNVE